MPFCVPVSQWWVVFLMHQRQCSDSCLNFYREPTSISHKIQCVKLATSRSFTGRSETLVNKVKKAKSTFSMRARKPCFNWNRLGESFHNANLLTMQQSEEDDICMLQVNDE
ncbi:unnamed protein product [Arctogadus glacialis]